jgi:predicted dehydrogenase
MMRAGIVGLGKMGVSHLAIMGAHPDVELAAICDKNGIVLDVLGKYSNAQQFKSFSKMIRDGGLDAVIVATPPAAHGPMVSEALTNGVAVFCEKPFILGWREADDLSGLAESKGLANQVGYHNRFVASFAEVKRLVVAGAIGKISHARAQAYGPVVLRGKGGTWRTKSNLGGGCLYDYAAHPINLLTWFFGVPAEVRGSIRKTIFSRDADDAVYSTFEYANGLSAHLSVNWSDASHRKMTTSVELWGENGSIFADRQEIRVFLRSVPPSLNDYIEGWTVRYTTELTSPVGYYLRGEEYSAQIDHFFGGVAGSVPTNRSSFRSASETDRVIEMIIEDSE